MIDNLFIPVCQSHIMLSCCFVDGCEDVVWGEKSTPNNKEQKVAGLN